MKHNVKKQRLITANNIAQIRVERFLEQARHTISQQVAHADSFDYEAATRKLSQRVRAVRPRRVRTRQSVDAYAAASRLPLRLAISLRRPQLAIAMAATAVIAFTALLLFVISISSGGPLVAVGQSSPFALIDTVLRFSSSLLTTNPSYEFEFAVAELY